MLKRNTDGTVDVICETCNGKLSDYLDRRASLPTNSFKSKMLAWLYGYSITTERCSYCV